MNEPGALPDGFSVDAVDWLPSGARSGLVRVRGHRLAGMSDPPAPLPELILETGGESRRYVSLPDPRADRDPTAWRGAYVLEAQPAAEADRLWLEWPGARRIALPPLAVPEHQVARSAERGQSEPPSAGEVVVDRAVLAERRARRAEASGQAQARISREALRAVEVLELRANEFEQRALEAEGERDALRGQAVEPDMRFEVLSREVRDLRAALARREAELERPEAAPIAGGDAERRAERLRAALTATVATVGELRLRLHELQVARRTVDVAAAADAVRLAVFEREREGLAAALETARSQLRDALQSRDEAAAALEGVRGAQEALRTQFGAMSAELGAARERIADLESEIAAVTAVAERSSVQARDAARAEAAALATEQAHDAQEQTDALRARLAAAEAAIAGAETARELAEASAMAAATQRQAAAVAHAASRPPRAEASGFRRPQPPPRVPQALIAAAAEAERAASERQRTDESDRIVADLDSAAAALRASEPAEQTPVIQEPAAAEEPAAEVEAGRTDLRIVAATADPPADLARGRSTREYPPLRGALVKLAHDDPAAAGRILAGLLKAQHAVVDAPPDYDLTITEVGTFAVSAAGQTTLVSPVDAPRGRGQAAFHLQTDALTFAETVAGVEARPSRRRGALRASGRVRAARKLTEGLRSDASLAELVQAGAELDPGLVLRGFAYAVRPAWTQGQNWAVELHVADRPLTVVARHGGGLTITDGPHDAEPDARLRLSADAFRDLVAGSGAATGGEGDERVLARLLALAERARTGSD